MVEHKGSPRDKAVSTLRSAELKLDLLIERRKELNDHAKFARGERDNLNHEKRRLFEEIAVFKEKRNGILETLRRHRSRRNELSTKARGLIEIKRDQKRGLDRSLPLQIQATKKDVEVLDMQQQTVPMTIHKENELLERIRDQIRSLSEMEEQLMEQDEVVREVATVSGSIDELFEMADLEHGQVVKFAQEIDGLNGKMQAIYQEAKHLIDESDRKHGEFLEYKIAADKVHEKVLEMRGKILDDRKERRDRARQARQEVKDFNKGARKALSPANLEKAADASLDQLLKEGKITLR